MRGDDPGFYEDDEPIETVRAAFNQGPHGVTAAPDDAPLTFEDCRRHADALLVEALADLRHWATGDITTEAFRALAVARTRIGEARRALALAAPRTKETT